MSSAAEQPDRLRGAALAILMAGLMLGIALAALDTMIMASALRSVADDLHGLTLQAWATTAYLVTSVASTPLYGKLADIYGRKPLYAIAIVLFLLGSVLASMAGSMYELAAGRAVQGLGAGGLMSLALVIVADVVPLEDRSRYQSAFSAVFAVAAVIGPFVGGLFADTEQILGIAGWRWVFLINLPVGLAALAVVLGLVRLPHVRLDHRLDVGGAATLTLGLVPLLIVAEQGREWGWASPLALASYLAGVVFLAAFVAIERRMGDEAMLPLRLLQGDGARTSGVNFFVGIGLFASMALVPLQLQLVNGLSPTTTGLLLLPQTAGIIVSARWCGPIVARSGRYRPFLVAGVLLMAAAALVFSRVDGGTSLWVVGFATGIMGLGVGLSFQVMLTAIQASARPQDMGAATASFTFFRQVGGTIGVAAMLTIVFSLAGGRIEAALDHAGATSAQREQALALDLDDSSVLERVDAGVAQPVVDGLNSAMSTAFLVLALLLLAGSALAWSLRDGRARCRDELALAPSPQPRRSQA